jgi:hypothetical protein
MRAAAVLLLPALAALACVGALTLVTGGAKPIETQSFVWKKRVFTNKQQFARWLNRRDVTYAEWAARHPGASPPWERKSDGGGLGAWTLLAALLGGIAAVVGFIRVAASRSARRALRSLLARTGFEPVPLAQTGVSLRSAVSAYGLWPPPRSQRPRDPERPELVLVEAPPTKPAAVAEARAASVAVEPHGDPPVVAPREPKAAAKPARKRSRRPARRPKKAAVARPPAKSAAPAEEPAGGEPKVEDKAPAPEPPSVDAHEPAVPPPFPSREVVCEVAFWRGYVSGQFYAHLRGDDRLSALATSPMFRCRSASPEETEERVAALAALHDLLVADGWEADGNGRAWYARRFTRHVPA